MALRKKYLLRCSRGHSRGRGAVVARVQQGRRAATAQPRHGGCGGSDSPGGGLKKKQTF